MRPLLLLVFTLPCFGLDPSLRLSQYHKQVWQIEDGLPHNYVNAIHYSPDGYLLVGTGEGLARFDGVRFTPLAGAGRIARDWISALSPGPDGSYWISTYYRDLYTLRGRALRHVFHGQSSLMGLFQDSSGALWINANGVFRLQSETAAAVGIGSSAGNAWHIFAEDSKRRVWIAAGGGLHLYEAGHARLAVKDGAAHGSLLSVMAEPDGAIWAGTSLGLFRVKESPGHVTLERQPGVSGPVVKILRDSDGMLWAATWGQGLFRVTPNGAENWSTRDGLPDDFIRTLFEDRDGNLWIGSRSGGLSRWKDPLIEPFGVPEGLQGNFASTVIAAGGGGLWMGTWRSGLYQWRDGRFRAMPTPVPAIDMGIRSLAEDGHGGLWLGTWEGLFHFTHGAYGPGILVRGVSAAILPDRNGGLWVGGSSLLYFPHSDPGTSPGEPRLPQANINCLLQDRQGRIWAGTDSGLAIIDGRSITWVHRQQGLADEFVTSLTEDAQGRVWASTRAGALAVILDGKARSIGIGQGLPGHPLFKLLDDGQGSFWISTTRGIVRIPEVQLDDLLAGRRARLDVALYEQEDGLRTIECHGLSQPAGWRAANGDLWFPTAKGFVRIRPERVEHLGPPPVRIEEIRAGSQPLGEPVELQPGARDLEVHFTALRFTSPGHVRFRYRLEDSDPDWIQRGTERSARYTSLPLGLHRLLVEAREPGGAWSAPVAIEIRQLPHFYQTAWFFSVVALALALLAWAFYRWRMYVVRGRYKAVLAERNRIAREWHDTLLAGFSAISWQLDATLTRLREQPARAAEAVDVARQMVHHYRAEARRVIWDLRENEPISESLQDAVARTMEQITAGTGVSTKLDVSGSPSAMSSDLRQNALRICQEATANAVRHGKAATVRVGIEYTPAALKLRIHDDGAGFELERTLKSPGGHFGLIVMQERARRFGGVLRIDSSPGNGTIIEADLPLQASKSE
ncbi:two-component regulator propeller domain-containing protein [uncultured Paludibaculum sp.]|uniref:sensor histidine kinase n=1 Tax=uncultured Paludibaculum sp. TaxID=1765020 RepID=UPI002AAC05E2|nr:two-component regulator propeller domain-containing protein [uncultured Paludibaculum sp.]